MKCRDCERFKMLIKMHSAARIDRIYSMAKAEELKTQYRQHQQSHKYWWLRYPKLQSIDVWLN